MKVGDLVKCNWQPSVSRIDKETQCCIPMQYTIEGEYGIIVRKKEQYCTGSYNVVLFPKFNYEHTLSDSALDLINQI
jgi:hypothetical protein